MQISGEPGLCDLHVSKAFYLRSLVGRVQFVILARFPSRLSLEGWVVPLKTKRGWEISMARRLASDWGRKKCLLYRCECLPPTHRTCVKTWT